MGRFDGKTCKLICVMSMVVAYFFVELVVGYFIQSLALIADSFHMLSDFIALIVGIVSQRLSKLPRNARNTFGWQRADVVGSLINTVILCTLCFSIFVRAIERFIELHEVHHPLLMVGVGTGGLVLNLVSLFILGHHGHSHGLSPVSHRNPLEITVVDPSAASAVAVVDTVVVTAEDSTPTAAGPVAASNGDSAEVVVSHRPPAYIAVPTADQNGGSNDNNGQPPPPYSDLVAVDRGQPELGHNHGHKGHKYSNNMRAVMQHVLADALGSIIVVISSLIIYFAPAGALWKKFVDPGMSIVLVTIIISSTAKLLYTNALILLQSVPNTIEYVKLKTDLENVVGQNTLHDLHVWRLQSECIIGTVHIRFRNIDDYLSNCKGIKSVFHNSGVHCTTIQPEFDQQDNLSLGMGRCVLDCGSEQNCDPYSCCPTNNPSPIMGDRDCEMPTDLPSP